MFALALYTTQDSGITKSSKTSTLNINSRWSSFLLSCPSKCLKFIHCRALTKCPNCNPKFTYLLQSDSTSIKAGPDAWWLENLPAVALVPQFAMAGMEFCLKMFISFLLFFFVVCCLFNVISSFQTISQF